MIKLTVDPQVPAALQAEFPKPANSARRTEYVLTSSYLVALKRHKKNKTGLPKLTP
jgi:hypothetical protein